MKACHDCVHTRLALCTKHRDPEEVRRHWYRALSDISEKLIKASVEYLFQPNPILHMLRKK